jgi:hypothetical protein
MTPRNLTVIAIMLLAPLLVLLGAAHLSLFSSSAVVSYGVLVLAWAVGMAALVASSWPQRIKWGLGIAYTLIAVPLAPFLALLAVCSTGDCI